MSRPISSLWSRGYFHGKNLPGFTLDVPGSAREKQYLGLKDSKPFSISQISARLILIELFSLYCTVCQRQAPIANKLYKFVRQDSILSKDIKMIAIGAGNNRKEVGFFKTRFRVPFPVFADPSFEIHRKFGQPRTPFTILANKSGKVLLTHYGVVKDVDEFLRQIRKLHKQP